MSIDVRTETLISLTEAAKLLPARRKGKRPHVSCLYRWTVSGCRGEILESVAVGGTRCTSKEAIARFIERLSAQRTLAQTTAGSRSSSASARVETAEKELAALGI